MASLSELIQAHKYKYAPDEVALARNRRLNWQQNPQNPSNLYRLASARKMLEEYKSQARRNKIVSEALRKSGLLGDTGGAGTTGTGTGGAETSGLMDILKQTSPLQQDYSLIQDYKPKGTDIDREKSKIRTKEGKLTDMVDERQDNKAKTENYEDLTDYEKSVLIDEGYMSEPDWTIKRTQDSYVRINEDTGEVQDLGIKPSETSKLSPKEITARTRAERETGREQDIVDYFEGFIKGTTVHHGYLNKKLDSDEKEEIEQALPAYNRIRQQQGKPPLKLELKGGPFALDYYELEPTEETTTETNLPEFNSIEEAENANLPSGTKILINGRKAVIE